MQFALSPDDGRRIEAARDIPAVCPGCAARVIPKMGEIVMHHWAHEAQIDCDPWWEPETAWHRSWKELAAPERREVIRSGHRADIIRSDGVVVELQHSSISSRDIVARERAYSPMIWLFDGRDLTGRFLISERPRRHKRAHIDDPPTYWVFRWLWPWKSLGFCNQPIYLDLGDDRIFEMRRAWGRDAPARGWGTLFLASAGFGRWLTA